MKRYVWTLISFGLAAWLTACTSTYEPAYEQALLTPTQETAVSTPTLKFVTPTLASTATSLPTPTLIPTDLPTAVPTTVPTVVPTTAPTATMMPTAVPVIETAVSPTIQVTTTITATQPVTTVVTVALTPTLGWQSFTSDVHGVTFQVPEQWRPSPDLVYGLRGRDGFVELLATNSQDNLLVNACNDMVVAFDTAVPLKWLTVAGQEACLIQTDDGSRATLIVRFPELRENIVPGVAYTFLVLQADPAHMPGIVETLTFFTPTAAPSPVP